MQRLGELQGEAGEFGSIAVVGAGMAGLTFTRAIERAGGRASILERAAALDSPRVSGDIRVPDAGAVLAELGVQGKDIARLRSAAQTSDPDYWPQQGLLLLLARNLRPGTLRLSSRVESVHRSQCGGLFCRLHCGELLGPFTLVVGAHGQLLTYNTPSELAGVAAGAALRGTEGLLAVIGDARWVRRRRWDFGTARRARGANTAMLDGLELAQRVIAAAPGGAERLRPKLGRYEAPAVRQPAGALLRVPSRHGCVRVALAAAGLCAACAALRVGVLEGLAGKPSG